MGLSETIAKVVQDGLCTGCGTCVGVCPKDAVRMVKDDSKGVYLPQLDGEKCDYCGICLKACPGYEVDFEDLSLNIFGRQVEDILLGNYVGLYTGHATEYNIRYNSASGGLVTSLLIFALEEGIIDGALVTRMRKDKPLEPEPFIARTREEIIEASGSKYCPVPANVVLKEISRREGRYAVVGLSCHIHGIRKAEKINKKLRERIVLHLGLFCNHTPSLLGTEYLFYRAKVKLEELSGLDYRGEGWPGKMRIGLKTGEDVILKFPDYWAGGFGHFFYPKRCLLCCDQGNELADISFGDPWGVEENDHIGTSMIVSRSEIGEGFLQKAAIRNVKLEVINRDRLQGVGLRRSAEASIRFYKLLGRPVPLYNRKILRPGLKTNLKAVSCYLQRYLGSKRRLWPLIPLISLARFLHVGKFLQ